MRDAPVAVLLEGAGAMPGRRSYVVATDLVQAEPIGIAEGWNSAESHAASRRLPAVRTAIAKRRPLIAALGEPITRPIGGAGLSHPAASRRAPNVTK